MPPLLTLLERRRPAGAAIILPIAERQEAAREWIPGLLRRPRWVLAGSVLATLALGVCACQIHYDHNLLNMQAQNLDSVRWERKLIDPTAGMDWHALSWTSTPEEALALKARYEKLDGVSIVVTAADLVPREQERKLEFLRDINGRLRQLPPRGELLERAAPNPAAIDAACLRLEEKLVRLEREGRSTAARVLRGSMAQLSEALRDPGAALKLRQYERLMTRDLG